MYAHCSHDCFTLEDEHRSKLYVLHHTFVKTSNKGKAGSLLGEGGASQNQWEMMCREEGGRGLENQSDKNEKRQS